MPRRKPRWRGHTSTRFGILLRQYLLERAWTQAELARRIGRDRSFITRVVLGQEPVDPQSIIAMSNAMNTDPYPLLEAAGWVPPGYRPGEQVLPPDVARLLDLLPAGWQRSMEDWGEDAPTVLRVLFGGHDRRRVG